MQAKATAIREELRCTHEQLWFCRQHLKCQSKLISKERQIDSQSAVKQAVPLVKNNARMAARTDWHYILIC